MHSLCVLDRSLQWRAALKRNGKLRLKPGGRLIVSVRDFAIEIYSGLFEGYAAERLSSGPSLLPSLRSLANSRTPRSEKKF
ncbi:hypothetical protein LSTR_LSTR000791 [Laodelphax striatellus]|uniref:Uncharacterized protein n=1 Tax=Laodelphax striatellus TaxID=195883 RepID=A0A482XH61_LAOST|nr:hypothetical protein LSTR_LSTR000791 [Laodelphax striatellus]